MPNLASNIQAQPESLAALCAINAERAQRP